MTISSNVNTKLRSVDKARQTLNERSNVSHIHSEFTGNIKSITTMEDTLDSQERVQSKTTTYLPQLDDQTDTQYAAYLQRASFPMLTKHVLSTFIGMALRKDIMTEGVPKNFQNNVDGAGTTLTKYTKSVITEFLSFGRCLTLTEYANKSKRAKLLLYKHDTIINWRTRVIEEKEQLSLVVLKENVRSDSNDEFNTATKVQYRVLSLSNTTPPVYSQRVYDEKCNLVSTTIPKKDRKTIGFIPAVIHGGVDTQKPPLLSIAEQNLAWYRIDADFKHGLHYTALPTPGTVGVDPDDKHYPKSIGATKLWALPEGAKAFMLEFTGAGLEMVSKAKTEIAENIITLSSRILSPPKNMNETATAASIRNAGETASLADTMNMLSGELTLSIEYVLNWDNITDKDVVSAVINTDFIPTILSGGDAASYGAMQNKGTLSRFSLFHLLKQGELHQGDRTLKQENEDIKKEQQETIDYEAKKAGAIAEAEAVALISVQDNAAKHAAKHAETTATKLAKDPSSGSQGASEEGKDNGDDSTTSPNSGKHTEQSNNSQNQREN